MSQGGSGAAELRGEHAASATSIQLGCRLLPHLLRHLERSHPFPHPLPQQTCKQQPLLAQLGKGEARLQHRAGGKELGAQWGRLLPAPSCPTAPGPGFSARLGCGQSWNKCRRGRQRTQGTPKITHGPHAGQGGCSCRSSHTRRGRRGCAAVAGATQRTRQKHQENQLPDSSCGSPGIPAAPADLSAPGKCSGTAAVPGGFTPPRAGDAAHPALL